MKSFFGCPLSEVPIKPDPARLRSTLEFLRPKPSPKPLVRYGGCSDGAYLIPEDLDGIRACFSPGVNNFKTFEDELTDKLGISAHMCDFSSDANKLRTPLREGMQSFEKLWLDVDGVKDSTTFEDWISRRAPGTQDLLLQMDIEGAEYRNLLATPRNILQRFRIIVMELHGLDQLSNPAVLENVFGPLSDKLSEDFICVHAHPNNISRPILLPLIGVSVPPLVEVTLLRRDRFKAEDVRRYPVQLPHPHDIPSNVVDRPPVFFDDFWRGRSPIANELSIMFNLEKTFQLRLNRL